MSPSLPAVTCVIPAYNVARWVGRAVQSVLDQDYGGPIQVVVVDDGSTDGTADRLAAYDAHVTLIRKANGGSRTALNAGFEQATGEFVVILDGDDVFDSRLVSAEVERMLERPELGLVFPDMRVIGESGEVLHPSFFAAFDIRPECGRPVGTLLSRNFASCGGMMVRADLLPVFAPIPEAAGADDWWIALHVAQHAELDFLDSALYGYRRHGANRNLGNAARLPLVLRDQRFRRWMLRTVSRSELVSDDEVLAGWTAFRDPLAELERHIPEELRSTLPVTEDDRAAHDRELAAARHALVIGETGRAIRHAVAAAAADPWSADARAPLEPGGALGRAAQGVVYGVEVNGLQMEVPEERVWAYPDGRYYEHNVVEWIDRLVGSLDAPVVHDVGANHGYYALRLASAARRVHAFEPVSGTFAVLQRNLRRNHVPGVRAHQVALADRDGSAEIALFNSSGSSSLYERDLPPGHRVHQVGSERIELRTLDELVASGAVEPPGVMKIDVEGAELAVLRGARRVLEEHRPWLVFEYAPELAQAAGYGAAELFAEVTRHGYRLYGLAEDWSDPVAYVEASFGLVRVGNVIAAPPGDLLPASGGDASAALAGARELVGLAFADEVAEDVELLRWWGATFDGSDDATLVVLAADRPGEALLSLLSGPVEAAGLASDTAADLLALPGPCSADLERALLERVAVVLSRRPPAPFASLPPFEPQAAAELRTLAAARHDAPV